MSGWHRGRSWDGTRLEDACPCPKEPCGLVDLSRAVPECDQHPTGRVKTMRQGHRAEDCPGSASPGPSPAPGASDGTTSAPDATPTGTTPQAPSHDQALIRGIEELRDHWGPTKVRAAFRHVLGEEER